MALLPNVKSRLVREPELDRVSQSQVMTPFLAAILTSNHSACPQSHEGVKTCLGKIFLATVLFPWFRCWFCLSGSLYGCLCERMCFGEIFLSISIPLSIIFPNYIIFPTCMPWQCITNSSQLPRTRDFFLNETSLSWRGGV